MEDRKINCIVIHGCPSDVEKAMDPETRTYDKHWIPWIKRELTSRGIKTETPVMPKPWYPDYEKFKRGFEKYEVKLKKDFTSTRLIEQSLSILRGRRVQGEFLQFFLRQM